MFTFEDHMAQGQPAIREILTVCTMCLIYVGPGKGSQEEKQEQWRLWAQADLASIPHKHNLETNESKVKKNNLLELKLQFLDSMSSAFQL